MNGIPASSIALRTTILSSNVTLPGSIASSILAGSVPNSEGKNLCNPMHQIMPLSFEASSICFEIICSSNCSQSSPKVLTSSRSVLRSYKYLKSLFNAMIIFNGLVLEVFDMDTTEYLPKSYIVHLIKGCFIKRNLNNKRYCAKEIDQV